jgi:hypothetical protein
MKFGLWHLFILRLHNASDGPTDIQSLLSKFSSVFAEPTSLPPSRDYDHVIPLKADAIPFNVHPYHYYPAHKDEIERQVADMLKAGIITTSMSPFASPVSSYQIFRKLLSWRRMLVTRALMQS